VKTPKQFFTKTALICAEALGLVWFSPSASAQTFILLKSFGNSTPTGTAAVSDRAFGPKEILIT